MPQKSKRIRTTSRKSTVKTENKMEELIEKYLLGLLSTEEQAALEKRIKTDSGLAEEVKVQRDKINALKISVFKNQISDGFKEYERTKRIKWIFIGVIISLILITILSLFKKDKNSTSLIELPKNTLDTTSFELHIFKDKSDSAEQIVSSDMTQKHTTQQIDIERFKETKPVLENDVVQESVHLEIERKAPIVNFHNSTKQKPVPQINQNTTSSSTTFPKQTHLQNHLRAEYPHTFKEIATDFDVNDPTFHLSFHVNYCNFKKTPVLVASDNHTTKEYKVDMSNKTLKAKEIKRIFALCQKDCCNNGI